MTRRVLIVEDDLLIAELERDYLAVEGYEADIAADGLEALNFFHRAEYDMILLDVMLLEINIRDLRIVTGSRRVYVGEKEIILANKEYEILLLLAENPDIVFSKDAIFEKVWGVDAMGDSATVAVHVNRIREKMERDVSDPQYIETVWGVGYRLRV